MQSNKLSNLSIIFAAVSVLFFPILFGPAALVLAIVGLVQKESRGVLALILSIVLPVIGAVLGAMVALNMS